jgi:uncharacterized protein YkwD
LRRAARRDTFAAMFCRQLLPCLLVLSAVAPLPRATAAAPVVPTGAKIEALDKLGEALLVETNRVRKQHGRSPLFFKAALTEAAADQAAYMALLQKAVHASRILGQRDALERVQRHGFYPANVAENVLSFKLEVDENPSVQELAVRIVNLWMNSPGHRANILRRDMAQLGCAVRFAHLADSGDAVFAAQVFAP